MLRVPLLRSLVARRTGKSSMTDAMGEGRYTGKAPAFLQRTAPGKVYGSFQISGPLLPGQQPEGETHRCAHCQKHFAIVPGSGTARGFCFNCDEITCGKMKCETKCTPWEKVLELQEGRDPNKVVFAGAHIL